MQYDLVVIGGGPAGLAAAIAARQAGVAKIVVLERDAHPGGILLQCIHNGFGLHYFEEELTGPEYAGRFVKQANELGITIKTDTMVLEMTPDKHITALNPTDGLMSIAAKAVVLAMGCRERTRGALVIPGTRPAGIFTAGAAQRLVNIEGYLPGRKVVILGSGDIGLIMARRLTLEGAEVSLICEIMPYSGGLTRNVVQCVEDFGIPLKLSHTITRIHGKPRVEGVTVAQVDGHRQPIAGTETFVPCDTILLSVGLIPENELTKGADIALDSTTGGSVVNECMETSQSGVFACGNAVHVHDLVDYVTEEAFRAGHSAALYIQKNLENERKRVVVRAGDRVRYVVPQFIDGQTRGCTLFFRATDVYRHVNLVISADGERLLTKRVRIVTPGEMQQITLKPEQIQKASTHLTVAFELPEQDID